MSSGVKRDRSRSPNNRGGGFRKERYKVLLKNLPYDVNWQKLKDICKEVGGEGVMFADIIQNQNGKSAGFGSVEFKTKEEMEEIAKKLDGHEVSGRALKCCPDINAEQLVRMCNKQGLDPGRSGMAAMGNRMGGPQGRGGPPHGRYGGGGDGYGPPGGRYGGGHGADRGGYGGPPPRGGGGYDEVPMLNGQPITSLPGMERLHPEVLEAIGKGPVGRTVFVRNLAYTVDEQKCREVFGMAGTIQSVDLVSDRETGKTKGFGTITFAQPIEAVKAIVMFHTQSLFDRKMFLKMDRNNQNRGKEKLPDGLSGINRMDEGNNGGGYSRGPPGGYQGGGGYNDRGPGSGPPGYGGGDRRYGGGPSGGDRGPGGGYGGGAGGGRDSYDSYGNGGGGGYGGGQRDSYAPPSSNGGYNNSGYGGGGGAGYGSRPSGCVISIENLPMSATTPRLRRLFEDAGRVSFVDLQDHGRAKIRFESHYDAEQAVARFHNYMIEGHGLQVRLADE